MPPPEDHRAEYPAVPQLALQVTDLALKARSIGLVSRDGELVPLGTELCLEVRPRIDEAGHDYRVCRSATGRRPSGRGHLHRPSTTRISAHPQMLAAGGWFGSDPRAL